MSNHPMSKRLWPILLITNAILGLMIAAVVTYLMPVKYESSVVIEIRPVEVLPSDTQEQPIDLSTEKQRLASTDLLEKVSHALELSSRWGSDLESSLRMLQNAIRIDTIHGTDLIVVSARLPETEDARDVARMPKEAVLIHDEPVIAETPVTPNIRFNLIVGGLSGLLVGFPLALIIMALLRPRNRSAMRPHP